MGSFGANLRNIRNCWGETLVDLASILDTNVSTVSQWENGKRTPSNDILKLLSLHYQVTIDDLLYGDFSELPSMVDYFVNLKDGGDALIKENMRLFPLFATESEKEDARFLKALEIQKKVRKGDENTIESSEFELFFDIFTDLFEKGGYPSAGANILSFLFLIAAGKLAFPFMDELEDFLKTDVGKNTRKKAKFLISNNILNSVMTDISSNEEIPDVKEFDETVLYIIENLKKDTHFYKVADYYFALRYVYGIVNNGLSQILNQQLGIYLLLDLTNINNPFAKRYFNFIKKVYKS